MTDPHDPRDFRIWLTFLTDGALRAEHAFDSSLEDPLPNAVDVTTLAPADFTKVVINPALLVARAVRHDQLLQQLAATSLARQQYLDATRVVVSAVADSLAGGGPTPRE